jgi:hypothetical protein
MNESVDKNAREISLKALILDLRFWVRYLIGKWKIILLFCFLGAGICLLFSLFRKPKYEASLLFVLEESHQGGLGSYAGIASQFGIDLGSQTNSGIFNQDNIIPFLKSRLMIERTMLSGINWGGREVSMADMYMDIYDLQKGWSKIPELASISFPANASMEKLTRIQDSVMNLFYAAISKNLLSVEKPDKKLNFIEAKVLSANEVFSKAFVERLVDEATRFYVTTKTMGSQKQVDRLQSQADSILHELNNTTYNAAVNQDLNQNPATHVATLKTELVNRDKMILQTMYAEVIKNLEMAKMTLAQDTPIIQVVDVPRFPLRVVRLTKRMAILIGGFLGVFLTVSVLVGSKALSNIMKQ